MYDKIPDEQSPGSSWSMRLKEVIVCGHFPIAQLVIDSVQGYSVGFRPTEEVAGQATRAYAAYRLDAAGLHLCERLRPAAA